MEYLMGLALNVITWLFSWLARVFTVSGAHVYWMALFAAFAVARLFLRPIIGDALSAPAREAVGKRRKARAANAKSKETGGND